MAKETPMMQQHREIKAKYPDAVLLFRVGDFYETFGEDAVIAARVLGITLTARNNGAAGSTELAGFPHHSLDTYLHKLVKAGHRVAICDQLEDPKEAKGVVKRGVTELVTPGMATDDKLLEFKTNNFLAAWLPAGTEYGLAFLDISTGEAYCAQGDAEYADKLLQGLQPAEVLVPKSSQARFREQYGKEWYLFPLEDWIFTESYGRETLLNHYKTQTLKGFGIEDLKAAATAAGAVLHYLKDTEHPNLQHITGLQRMMPDTFLWMDRFTVRNLELLSAQDGSPGGLLAAIDTTLTPMGGRLLRRRIVFPLSDRLKLEARHDAVESFLQNKDLHEATRTQLKAIGDLERLVAKIPLKKSSPRELIALARGLSKVCTLKFILSDSAYPALEKLVAHIHTCDELQERINKTLAEEAPAVAAKGNFIREGVSEALDELRGISRGAKDYLLDLQKREAQTTGISSLKVSFNNVFGYYLEVTHTHKDKVPPTWIRKQTLAAAERYITPELKEYEDKILGADEKILTLEMAAFAELLDFISPWIPRIQQAAKAVANLDCLSAHATTARQWNYVRPTLTDDATLRLKAARHPVIEQKLPPGESYISNDLFLDRDTEQIIILTGPNMSGKSAVLRQTALCVLLAHMGAFVPAAEAYIGITDRIFTRVGASDNLAGGESTFMVEMTETASIVNNLSERSLVLLDEIGRGTSTYDGISIAWSLVEYLHSHATHPKTLFATHYHELNDLENSLGRVKNFHITHQETAHKIIFLRKMARGGSRRSFGIQVARMAGMPPTLISRAEELLHHLEQTHADAGSTGTETSSKKKTPAPVAPIQQIQLSVFGDVPEHLRRLQQELEAIDINTLSPVEALLRLNALKASISHGS